MKTASRLLDQILATIASLMIGIGTNSNVPIVGSIGKKISDPFWLTGSSISVIMLLH